MKSTDKIMSKEFCRLRKTLVTLYPLTLICIYYKYPQRAVKYITYTADLFQVCFL